MPVQAALSSLGKTSRGRGPAARAERPAGIVAVARQSLPAPPSRVAIVVPRAGHPLSARAASAWPDAVVVTEVAGGDLGPLRDRLAVGASYDLVLDAVGRGLRKRIARLLPLVGDGGRYVGRLPPGHAVGSAPGWLDRRHPEAGTTGGCVAVGPTARLLVPLREDAQNAVLTAQPARGRVLLTLPPERVECSGTVTRSRPMPGIRQVTACDVPSLSLREHRDVTCAPYLVAHYDTFVLAASFREPERKRLLHKDLTPGPYGYLAGPAAECETLPGRWFYLDTNIPDHFGHAVTEQLSHVWGWAAAKERFPEIRALVFAPPSGEVSDWAWDLWEAAGLARSDVHVLHRPARAETLVTCSPMLRIGEYVHPGMRRIWGDAGERLSTPATRDSWPERVFHTRGGHRRACRNRELVEDLFRGLGFEIVSPAQHSLAEQVQLARHARTIAGFAGSGMYQIAFTGEPKHVIAIGAESYAAHNEHLMAALLGHRLDLVVCRADVPRGDPPKFSAASYASSFEFDTSEDAETVRRVVG